MNAPTTIDPNSSAHAEFSRAAAAGDVDAQAGLARLYISGRGTARGS
mgnify:CR=1 FL=1